MGQFLFWPYFHRERKPLKHLRVTRFPSFTKRAKMKPSFCSAKCVLSKTGTAITARTEKERRKNSQQEMNPASYNLRASVEISTSKKDLQQANPEMCAWQDRDRSILLARGKPAVAQNPCQSTTMALCPAFCTPPKTTPWLNVIVWVHCCTNGSRVSWGYLAHM